MHYWSERVLQHTDLMQRGHSKSDTVRTPRVFSLQRLLSPETERERGEKTRGDYCVISNHLEGVTVKLFARQWQRRLMTRIMMMKVHAYLRRAHPPSSSSPRPLQQQGGRKQLGRGWGSTQYPHHASPWSPEDNFLQFIRIQTRPTIQSARKRP